MTFLRKLNKTVGLRSDMEDTFGDLKWGTFVFFNFPQRTKLDGQGTPRHGGQLRRPKNEPLPPFTFLCKPDDGISSRNESQFWCHEVELLFHVTFLSEVNKTR